MASSQSSSTLPQSYVDEYNGDRLKYTAIAFIFIEPVFVALRIWARRFSRSSLSWDDFMVPLALPFGIGMCITALLAISHGGVGHHIETVPRTKRVYWLKASRIAIPVLYVVASSLPKLAILVVYLKVFTGKPLRICCYACGLVITLSMIINIPLVIWRCSPMSYLWDKSQLHGWCIPQEPHLRYGTSLTDIVTDVVMLILPIPLVWNLQTSRKVKIGLMVTFLTGSIGLFTAIIRFVEFFRSFKDGTWTSTTLSMWVIIKSGIYMIAACLLAYRPLVSYLIYESLLSTLFSRSRHKSDSCKPDQGHTLNGGPAETGMELSNNESSDNNRPVPAYKYSTYTVAERDGVRYPNAKPSDSIHVEHEFELSSKPAP